MSSRRTETTAWAFIRTSGVDFDPATLIQRANHWASKLRGFSSVVLLLRREGNAMAGYLLTRGSGADSMRTATDLAHAVGARAEQVELPEGLDVVATEYDEVRTVVGTVVYADGSAVARDPQVGANPSEMARLLANSLPDGCWVAISLRAPDRSERNRWNRWLAHRLSTAVPTHHSMTPNAVVISIFAGGPDRPRVESLLESVHAAMPGFDLIVKTRVDTRAAAAMPWLPAGLGALVLTGIDHAAGSHLAGADGGMLSFLPALVPLGFVLGSAALLAGLGRALGLLPSAWSRWPRMLANAAFPSPPKRLLPPKRPRREVNTSTKQQSPREGDYPLHAGAFQVGPHLVTGVVSPHGSAASGVVSTQARPVPPVMLDRIGPLIGSTPQGAPYLSAPDMEGGVAVVGRPGSGKSQWVRSMFGWSCLDRVDARTAHAQGTPRHAGPGFPGASSAVVVFESKGEGITGYQQWADATGEVMVVCDLADPATPAIDLFAIEGTVLDKANFFVNALRYVFGDAAVGDRSFETLLALTPAALLAVGNPTLTTTVPGLSPDGSAMYYLHVLLGGRGIELGSGLAGALAEEAAHRDADPILGEVVSLMGHLYGPKVTEAQRRPMLEASRNKIRQIVELEAWWTPARRKVTWAQVLGGNRIVAINTGTSRQGKLVEEESCAQMSALLMYSLRHSIQRICSGWQDQGRTVEIYADELSLLAGSSEQVITWLKDQGRSYGVRPVLATQRPEQLPDRVRSAFMNFSTLVSFAQEDLRTAREIAEGVSGGDADAWAPDDILQLDPYVAVVRSHVGKKRQPAFTMAVPHFEANRPAFASAQGYPALAAATAPMAPAASIPQPQVAPRPDLAPVPHPGYDVAPTPAPPALPTYVPAPDLFDEGGRA